MALSSYYAEFPDQHESDFSNKVLNILSDHFDIEEEVWGTHLAGRKLRIDAVIKPKDISEWKNKDIAFGLEFKSPSKLVSFGNQLNFMKQCVDYSYTKFEGFGFIPILSCPRFSLDETYSNEKALTTLRHFLNRFRIGELDKTYRGVSIIFAEHHYIWADGKVNEGKKWELKPNFGSK